VVGLGGRHLTSSPARTARIAGNWLYASGLLCAAGALAHLLIPLGGPGWYSFFAAPPGLIAMAEAGLVRPAVTCAAIAAILFLIAAYAFSGLGLIRRLPGVRLVLAIVGLGLVARGAGFLVVAVSEPGLLARACGRCDELNVFVVSTSALCLFIGIGYLLGAWRPFRDTLTFDAATGKWRFTIEASDGSGKWKHFAAYEIERAR
jgi:putative oxidoreductase